LKIRRLLLGLLLIALAAFFLLGEHLAEGSKSAVLNARKATVRTPIEGILDLDDENIHQTVHKNEIVGTVLNPLLEEQNLYHLETRLDFLGIELEALRREREDLRAQREALLERQKEFLSFKKEHLREGLALRNARVSEAEANLRQAAADRQRAENLAARGAATPVRLEAARAEEEAARQRLAQRRAESAQVASELEAVDAGFILETGMTDLSGSASELLQIEQRLDAIASEQRSTQSRIVSLEREIEITRRHQRRDSKVELTSPVHGQIWRIFANDGERVQPGDPIFELVDCSDVFVTLTVRRSVYQRLEIGDPARFAFDRGPTLEGRVRRLSGQEGLLTRTELISPIPGRAEDRYTVALEVPALSDHPALACAVGKSGRVYFGGRPLDFLRRLFPS
jgi:multidrug resistance efflux pump